MWFLYILLLVFILGIIILIHEFGHFIFAKKSGVHIYEFSMGMGPLIFQKKGKDGINYSVRLLPIGGYVQMAGEVYEDDDLEKIPKEKFMCNRPWYQRIMVIIAGVVFNFILALFLLLVIAGIWGAPTNKTVIAEVSPEFPVAKAGIVAGDTITAVNGKKATTWDKTQLLLTMKSKDDIYKIEVKHADGTTDTYDVKPETVEDEKGNETKVFGVSIKQDIKKGVGVSLKYAFTKFGTLVESMAIVVGGLFTGGLSLKALSGPVGMYEIVGQQAQAGIQNILFLIAYLSINVGFINILPFPAFDGGRAMFMIIEKIKGSPINSKFENACHTVGFVLLIILMLVVTCQDILKLF